VRRCHTATPFSSASHRQGPWHQNEPLLKTQMDLSRATALTWRAWLEQRWNKDKLRHTSTLSPLSPQPCVLHQTRRSGSPRCRLQGQCQRLRPAILVSDRCAWRTSRNVPGKAHVSISRCM
jgi:hypothetical protein